MKREEGEIESRVACETNEFPIFGENRPVYVTGVNTRGRVTADLATSRRRDARVLNPVGGTIDAHGEKGFLTRSNSRIRRTVFSVSRGSNRSRNRSTRFR